MNEKMKNYRSKAIPIRKLTVESSWRSANEDQRLKLLCKVKLVINGLKAAAPHIHKEMSMLKGF